MLISNLINEVNHIGNNINQIARKNNAGFYSRDDMDSLRAYMKKLINATRKVEERLAITKVLNIGDCWKRLSRKTFKGDELTILKILKKRMVGDLSEALIVSQTLPTIR
ncbi:MAG: plasmid mobilization relaxosome protein MobC [Eubacterium ventriosum]